MDGRVTFTSTQGDQNYWRLRIILMEDTMVTLQAITFAEATDMEARRQVDAGFARLTSSFHGA